MAEGHSHDQPRRPIRLSLTEFAGSMGDFGTLLPLAIGYIVVCGLDPAGFLVMMGLANIVTGLVYGLPMPIEPMKALAVVAIAQAWSPSLVYASGFSMGLIWLTLGGTGAITWIARNTPRATVAGIQITLGILLAKEAISLSSGSWFLAIAGVVVVLTLRKNRYAPAALVLVGGGLLIMAFTGGFSDLAPVAFRLPSITRFTASEMWYSLLNGGFAQVPLTAANAVIATSALITSYWPDVTVTPRKLAFSHGVMNVVSPFFGGMPMCHGAGGLVGQYFYGARTAGTNLIEGTLEVVLGLFFAGSIAALFGAFPTGIIGAMMFMVGIELIKFVRHMRAPRDFAVAAITVVVALLTNMAFGFAAGIIVHQAIALVERNRAGSAED
jgi:hypothetical protein